MRLTLRGPSRDLMQRETTCRWHRKGPNARQRRWQIQPIQGQSRPPQAGERLLTGGDATATPGSHNCAVNTSFLSPALEGVMSRVCS